MKCRRCREPAVIDVRRHNAGFCAACFTRHCGEQVRRAIEDHDMIARNDRVLVAVSGGKDSLGLWQLLRELGYEADGLYVGLGIGEYSDQSGEYARAFAALHGWPLLEIDLRGTFGFDVPGAAKAIRRVPCSACGLSKRHVFNDAAIANGYNVLATGHNLDDEAAVLLGNVLRWDEGYLGRQQPVLPAAPGFVRKVKPLVRLGERELAAYCVLTGIDYIVEECPMAAGNRHLGYKELLNELEERSPGTKAAFLFGFIERGHERFAQDAVDEREDLHPCPECGSPTPAEVCAFCRLQARANEEDPTDGRDMSPQAQAGAFAAGDQVLLVDNKKRRHLVTLEVGGQFHTHAGIVAHDDLIGHPDGMTVHTSRGARLVAVRPTLAEYVLEMPRGAQVIYPKDLGPILVLADIFPGARILESGVGSGALTSALLRAIGPTGHVTGYEIRDDFAQRAVKNVHGFLGEDVPLDVEVRDVYEGIEERDLDRIVLDLPEPWRVVKHALDTLRPGGILLAYLPTILQVGRLREELANAPFGMVETLEVLQRTWHVEGQSIRPDHRMVAHTGFLTHGRLLARDT